MSFQEIGVDAGMASTRAKCNDVHTEVQIIIELISTCPDSSDGRAAD